MKKPPDWAAFLFPLSPALSREGRGSVMAVGLWGWLGGGCPLSPALFHKGRGSVMAAGLGLTAEEAADVGPGAVAAGLSLFDGDVFGAFPFQVFLGQFVEEAAGQAVDDFAELAAAGGEGEGEVALGPGDGDVGQTAFLVHGVGLDAGAVGQYLFLHAHDIDVGVFQAL